MFKREALIAAAILPAIIVVGLLVALLWPQIERFFK
jgi:hypothetical protein